MECIEVRAILVFRFTPPLFEHRKMAFWENQNISDLLGRIQNVKSHKALMSCSSIPQ